jgi:hypothetical protein
MAWITTADVQRAAGLDPAATVDVEWLAEVTTAAESWARGQRDAAGYGDDPDPDALAPNPAVKQGTVLYALNLYRSRGTYGGAPSFDGMGAVDLPAPIYAQTLALLGVPRATVDAPAYPPSSATVLGRPARRSPWP